LETSLRISNATPTRCAVAARPDDRLRDRFLGGRVEHFAARFPRRAEPDRHGSLGAFLRRFDLHPLAALRDDEEVSAFGAYGRNLRKAFLVDLGDGASGRIDQGAGG